MVPSTTAQNPSVKICSILIAAFIWLQIVLVGLIGVMRMQRGLPLDFQFGAALPVVNASTLSQGVVAMAIGSALASQFLRSRLTEDGGGVPFAKWIIGLALSEFVGLCGFIVAFTSDLNLEIQVIFSVIAIACIASYGTLVRHVMTTSQALPNHQL